MLFLFCYVDCCFYNPGKYHIFLLKNEQNQYVGFCTIVEYPLLKEICVPGNFHIEEFYIAKEFRGQGYGKEAVKLIFEMYGTEGSLCILERNIPAIKFWTKMFKKYTAEVKCQRDTINVECYLYSFVPVVKECYYG